MRWRRATPYAETAALQTNTATNPRKTFVAMESRIDLHSSAHAQGSVPSPARSSLRRHGPSGPGRRHGRGPPFGRAVGTGGRAPRRRPRRGAWARGDDDARVLHRFRPRARLRHAPARLRSAGGADAPLCVAPWTLRGDGARPPVPLVRGSGGAFTRPRPGRRLGAVRPAVRL